MATKKPPGLPGGVRVRFLEANASARGAFAPGDVMEVLPRRARIWCEGGVVELVDVPSPDAPAASEPVEDAGVV